MGGQWVQAEHHLPGILFDSRSQFSATGLSRPGCQVLCTSPGEPVFLLTADPLLLIGILFLWPLCLRNGLKSPADWPKAFLPPGGRADAMCLFYGTYLFYWTLIGFPLASPFPPPSRLWDNWEPFWTWQVKFQRHHRSGCKPEGWDCGLSAALVRNAPCPGGRE